ncbi:MAG: ABC transporter permease [Anaerolineae bacterium]|nr:ABC transporter permease [Anaerolineae bacterium]
MMNIQTVSHLNGVYRQQKRNRLRNFRTFPFYLLSIGLGLLLWQMAIIPISDTARRFVLPAPNDVLARFVKLLLQGTLLRHVQITLLEMGLGLLAGTTTALLLGYAVAHNQFLAYLIEPIIVTSQAVPIVALAPLLTIWFGPGLISKVIICALIVFFPILINVIDGLKTIDPYMSDLFKILKASPWNKLCKLELPAALPSILAGLKIGGTLAGMGAVVGEFVASSAGIGYLVKQGQNLYDTPLMFAAIFVLIFIALSVYGALALLERLLLRGRHLDNRMSASATSTGENV